MVSVTKMSKQVPPKAVSKKKNMKKTQAKKAINEKPVDAKVDGSLKKAASDSRMGKKVAPKTVPKKKKTKKTPVKKAINEEPADGVINDGLEKQENGSRNGNEQQLENKEKDQASPKKNVKAKKNKKKKMNKSLETAQEALQENQGADEESNDDKMQIENPEAKTQNKKKRKSDSQDTAENKGGVKTNKKKKMKSVNTAEKPSEENKEADDEKFVDDVEEDKDEQKSTKGLSDEEKEEIDRRTIFVGNVYIKTKRSALRNIFKEYGEIETIRFRNAAVADPNESKRVAMIKRHFHESQVSITAYVKFKTEESAIAALSANNTIFKERHLQVDRVSGSRKVDPKCSVFIGNLPFDANEEELREIFQDCGAIDNVRIVRDKLFFSSAKTSLIGVSSGGRDELLFPLPVDGKVHLNLLIPTCYNVSRHEPLNASNNSSPPVGTRSRRSADKSYHITPSFTQTDLKASTVSTFVEVQCLNESTPTKDCVVASTQNTMTDPDQTLAKCWSFDTLGRLLVRVKDGGRILQDQHLQVVQILRTILRRFGCLLRRDSSGLHLLPAQNYSVERYSNYRDLKYLRHLMAATAIQSEISSGGEMRDGALSNCNDPHVLGEMSRQPRLSMENAGGTSKVEVLGGLSPVFLSVVSSLVIRNPHAWIYSVEILTTKLRKNYKEIFSHLPRLQFLDGVKANVSEDTALLDEMLGQSNAAVLMAVLKGSSALWERSEIQRSLLGAFSIIAEDIMVSVRIMPDPQRASQ
ncbi:uncharacterized protein LOC125045943 [Penaeus chinensis]|uniref:uncharacterized protein LOC125045943 n=1 Tax=Penaeus chinensis TaxID=139456 RepID=UPI001FB70BE3|nr:uncharacterized protein LOC125045943 [Penaeus chinensis]